MAICPECHLHQESAGFRRGLSLPRYRPGAVGRLRISFALRYESSQTRTGSQPHFSEEQIPGEHAIAKRTGHGVAQDSDFAYVLGHSPLRRSPCLEKHDIPWPDPALGDVLVADESLTRHHNNGLVLVVMPAETTCSAIPHHNVGSAVMASRQLLASGFRLTLENPITCKRGSGTIRNGSSSKQDRFGHANVPCWQSE